MYQKNNNLKGYYKRWLTHENGIQTPWLQISQNNVKYNKTHTSEKWLAQWCNIKNLIINVLTHKEVFRSSASGCTRNQDVSHCGCLINMVAQPAEEASPVCPPSALLLLPHWEEEMKVITWPSAHYSWKKKQVRLAWWTAFTDGIRKLGYTGKGVCDEDKDPRGRGGHPASVFFFATVLNSIQNKLTTGSPFSLPVPTGICIYSILLFST